MPVHYAGPPQIGYCTNVHAGADWLHTKTNLERYAVRVRRLLGGEEPLGIGLWLSATAARELLDQDGVTLLEEWLRVRRLFVFTLNGFPYGDFHQPVVKHAVYEPDWSRPERAAYTRDLAEILGGLIPEGGEGSVSTLPLGWAANWDATRQARAADNIRGLCHFLKTLEAQCGRLIHLDLEPEPGCVLQTSADVVRFFDELAPTVDDAFEMRRYLRVCHDICHAAVMFEDQSTVLRTYAKAGVAVGKVQVSAAIRIDMGAQDEARRAAARDLLNEFAEPRYLHQTVIRTAGNSRLRQFDDLPAALAAARADTALATGEWRIHYHVPIYLGRIGLLGTTQPETLACLKALGEDPLAHHFEVETYAWNVLPEEIRGDDLPAGIARELGWLKNIAAWS